MLDLLLYLGVAIMIMTLCVACYGYGHANGYTDGVDFMRKVYGEEEEQGE